jgi:putative DNA primase/helicase
LINLETGELRDRVREDYLTFTTNSVYDPTLNVDGVEKWISDMMLNKPDLVAYLKVMLGYGITGEVTEQILPIFMGSGGNGKGVLLRALFNVLGKDLFSNVEQSVLMKSNKSSAGQASPQLAQLDGARIACLTETDANEQLSEGLVKQLTGGDSFACRPLYSDIIEVTPQFLAIIQTNNPPTLRMDDAVRRRPIVFPFLAEFKSVSKYDPQNPRHILADANIDDTVDAMRDNFLTWLVQGAVEWYRTKNLKDTKPRDVAVHTDQYLDGQDVVMQFLTYCEISDADGKAYPRKKTDGGDGNPFTVKTALYSEFCGQNDSGQSIKRTEFYSLMSKRGFDSVPLSTATGQYKKGTRVYWGIKIPETENAWDL